MITLEFLLTSLVVVLVPGTGVLFTVATGLARGRRAAFFAAFGCTVGIVPHLLATIMGLAALMHASALGFQILKYAGVAYLFYLAIAMWRDQTAFTIDAAEQARATGFGAIVLKGFLVNILNPKLTIFFLAFLPQFVDPSRGSSLAQLLVLSGVFMAMTFAVFVVYGAIAHAFSRAVAKAPLVQTWMRRSFAAAFAGLGAQLALSARP